MRHRASVPLRRWSVRSLQRSRERSLPILFGMHMAPPESEQLALQVAWLFILAIPIASVAWTVTHEEVFREPRDYCSRRSAQARSIWRRKFYYLFTCEYCFSHYVVGVALLITRYRLLFDDWRGYVVSFFALIWVANLYMSVFSRLRVDIRSERAAANVKQMEAQIMDAEQDRTDQPMRVAR